MTTWLETADGEAPSPPGMAVSGPVRRRAWRSETVERRFFELTAYVGIDTFGAVVVYWEATLWNCGMPQEVMTSGTKLFDALPMRQTRLECVAATISPGQVSRYAVWSDALHMLERSNGMGELW
jgi:hypothetical protein